jgi:hypothetical protein
MERGRHQDQLAGESPQHNLRNAGGVDLGNDDAKPLPYNKMQERSLHSSGFCLKGFTAARSKDSDKK